jgi:hypothetical protein
MWHILHFITIQSLMFIYLEMLVHQFIYLFIYPIQLVIFNVNYQLLSCDILVQLQCTPHVSNGLGEN